MTIFLDGIATRFYRGIGPEVQYISPFSKLNFFIGPNNSGKSIILDLLANQVAQTLTGKKVNPPSGHEEYKGKETGQFLLAIGKNMENAIKLVTSGQKFIDHNNTYRHFGDINNDISKICGKISRQNHLWLKIGAHKSAEIFPALDIQSASNWLDSKTWQTIWNLATQHKGGSLVQHWVPETINYIANTSVPTVPNIHLIPAKRVFGEKGEALNDLSGRGLIDHLAALQNPSWNKQEDREKFAKINMFIKKVTGKDDAQLEVPNDREHLLVHIDNKVLPLAALGTGIHEVIILAAFCTINDRSIMCIEEPEIHLHPLLQRKLISYLVSETSSQYFISTHSSSFMDTANATIFRVTNDGEQTRVQAVVTKDHQRSLLDDLGYHASDLLQTNMVIWVEGPSDRIYVNHWINVIDDRLIEGIHYTIMFYGGALIRHLTASDDALKDFISLRSLNRNMAVILDSDKADEHSPLKPHAQRLSEEICSSNGMVWVTAGREIENYVDGAKLQDALKKLHSKIYRSPAKTGIFDHAFYFYRDNPEKKDSRLLYKDADKVGAANLICEDEANVERLDLRERLVELTHMICQANSLNPR